MTLMRQRIINELDPDLVQCDVCSQWEKKNLIYYSVILDGYLCVRCHSDYDRLLKVKLDHQEQKVMNMFKWKIHNNKKSKK